MNPRLTTSRRSAAAFLTVTLTALSLSLGIGSQPAGAQFPPNGHEIGFPEDFALAANREEALAQLIPGSDEYYYYLCLHYQNVGELDKVPPLLNSWGRKSPNHALLQEMRHRQALLTYERSPEETLTYLRDHFHPELNYRRIVPGQSPDLPSVLDAAKISRRAFEDLALRQGSLNGIRDSGLPALIGRDGLKSQQIRELLNRLERPDHEGLAALVEEELKNPNSSSFGSLEIHNRLLLSQLNTLRRALPNLDSDQNFVHTYLRKLVPPAGTDLHLNNAAKDAHLSRLLEFTSTLPPVFNALKAHVLYQKLEFDESVGRYDKGLFMEYLKLPRNVFYINPVYIREQRGLGVPAADLNQDFTALTQFPPIITDEPLVRRYLMQFFLDASGWAEFQTFIQESYLKEVFAETKLLNGIGEPEQWFSLISPERLQELRDRVEIQFLPSNPRQIDRDDIPRLNAWVKNVSTLIVRVYEINTDNYFRQNKEELSTSVNLDGLVANQSQTYTYTEPPLRRVRREFQFPELTGPGAWIIELIGNGFSSRVVVRKGRLQYLLQDTPAGQEFTVLTEENAPVPGATLWLNGQYFRADTESGVITVPYTNAPGGEVPIVLSDGGFSSLAHFTPAAENYALDADFLLEPQSLLSGETARVAIRARLSINGEPMHIGLLEKPKLVIRVTSNEVESTQVAENFELKEDAEAIYEFTVPPNANILNFTLEGEVKKLSGGDPQKLSKHYHTTFNAITLTERMALPLLTRTPEGYQLELRGKNGEPLPGQPLVLTFIHRDFAENNTVNEVLRTDEAGTLRLGALNGIERLVAKPQLDAAAAQTFHLPLLPQWHELPGSLHMAAEGNQLIPFRVNGDMPLEEQVSLLELRDGSFSRDWLKAVTPQNGFLSVAELPPGDYSLKIKPVDHVIHLSVAQGERKLGWVVGPDRYLELSDPAPLQILGVTTRDANLEITLANAGPLARVHLIATRYLPGLEQPQGRPIPLRQLSRWPAEVQYESGRLLGEEYRYVIERKYVTKFPGNLLGRPALILNPWELHDTETDVRQALAGEEFSGKPQPSAAAMPASPAARARMAKDKAATEGAVMPNYDFLPEGPITAFNLKPDDKGVLTLPLEQLGPNNLVRVLAVDAVTSASWDMVLPPPAEFKPRDLRLKAAFDARTHRAQTSQISALLSGRKILFQDADSTDYQTFDTLARIFDLYETLDTSGDLPKFRFLLNWPKLTDVEKQEHYSDNACHELSFFLYKKDRVFFDSVVKPYLRNKKDKTFLDHWLLEDDLAGYRELPRFQRLNVFEQILLSQRFPEMQTETFRRLAALYDINPTPPERWNMLFETALRGRALATGEGEGTGTRTEQKSNREARRMREVEMSLGALAPPPPMEAAPEMAMQEAAWADDAQKSLSFEAPQTPQDFSAAESSATAVFGGFADARGLEKMKELREQAKAFYRAPEKTKELAENNYFERPIEEQDAQLIPLNAFWRDFAVYDGDGPFVSENFAEASENLHAMLLALAVQDIPYEPAQRQEDRRETGLEITAGGPMVMFRREFAPAEADSDANKVVFVSQHFFAANDKFVNQGQDQEYKYVEDEFVKGRVYGAHIIVTNSSATTRKLNVLAQIPQGSLPVQGGRITRAIPIQLPPYSTQPIEYYFYFPEAGEFPHYPVQVSQAGDLLAFAEPVTFKVLPEPSGIDESSWDWISQNADDDALFKYLDEANLERLNLAKIAFRMDDQAFFTRMLDYLRRRQLYSQVLWAYGFKHNDAPALKEYLEKRPEFVAACGMRLQSPLLAFGPVEWRFYQYLEYEPLINARIHRLGSEPNILNDRFLAQYREFMQVLGYKPTAESEDRLALSGYLFLQDRIGEALDQFDLVKPEELAERMQYDYLAAYTSFYRSDLGTARAIVDRYLNYPVPRWRERFEQVKAQLDDIQGNTAAGASPDALKQENAGPETVLEARLDGTSISVTYAGLGQCTINYYLMDVEMLFSRNPFLTQDSGRNGENSGNGDETAFSIIQPNLSQVVTLPAGQDSVTQAIPEEFRSRNLIIEVREAGLKRTLAYYANRLIVELNENYGRLKVRDATSRKVLPRIYVKVYARLQSGEITFYKDGYTDLRGVFDYTSLSNDMLDNVDRLALLILSEEAGAVVKETAPPQR